MSQYVLGVDGGGTKTNAVILDEHALCWLLRSSARVFGIKRVEAGVSCCVLFYTYLKFHWEQHGQIPFLASRTHQKFDKTCYLNNNHCILSSRRHSCAGTGSCFASIGGRSRKASRRFRPKRFA